MTYQTIERTDRQTGDVETPVGVLGIPASIANTLAGAYQTTPGDICNRLRDGETLQTCSALYRLVAVEMQPN